MSEGAGTRNHELSYAISMHNQDAESLDRGRDLDKPTQWDYLDQTS